MNQKTGVGNSLQSAREKESAFGANSNFYRKFSKFLYLDILVVVVVLFATGYLNALLVALLLGLSLTASLAVALVIPLLYMGILYAFRNRNPTFGILRIWWLRRRPRKKLRRSEET